MMTAMIMIGSKVHIPTEEVDQPVVLAVETAVMAPGINSARMYMAIAEAIIDAPAAPIFAIFNQTPYRMQF